MTIQTLPPFLIGLSDRRKPDFNNLLTVLQRGVPARPTLFEFYLNDRLYAALSGDAVNYAWETVEHARRVIQAYHAAGYDFATVVGSSFTFPKASQTKKTISLNDGASIHDWESFNSYPWPNPDQMMDNRLETLAAYLPEGMKLIVWGPGGVLENVIALVGFDNLCYMLADDEELVAALFDAVGSRMLRYYELCAPFDAVGALISNDDWGFGTQTMLNLNDMRRFVFPWHKKIVEAIHAHGKPAILHSCGMLEPVMPDIADYMGYDGKHSFEDKIVPIEIAYPRWSGDIAILGGLDLDFMCRSTPDEVYTRAKAMLQLSEAKGAYALGTGNSVPVYVPDENYFAMLRAAVE